jgi:hypothetical protein
MRLKILSAGTVIWLGIGETNYPAESTHEWSQISGSEAVAPDSLGIMDNSHWYEHPDWVAQYGSESSITASVVDFLRQFDVLQSFGECGGYSAVSYVYTPAVGATQPNLAKCIVFVRGACGPPWSEIPVAAEGESWGGVKGLFR